ncbi:MAG TPA: hypothetical protein VF654_06690, partial [Pyrinomonadaceae bacterium]
MERSLELTPEETARVRSPAATTARGVRAHALERGIALVHIVLTLLGLSLRVQGISELGFAEDEINKLEAVRAYARGDITPNAEHPMLMK